MRSIYSAIFNNMLIKAVSLFLALLTWSYVIGHLYQNSPLLSNNSSAIVKMQDSNIIVKKLPVHVNLTGRVNPRYEVAVDRIRIRPAECIVSGTQEKIEQLRFVTTEPISIEGATKTIKKKIRLSNLGDYKFNDEQEFLVIIPVARKRD